jgi:mono/diheme cytochrome c family protein
MKTALMNSPIGIFVFAGIILAFSPDSAADHGREIYAAQKCALCHSIEGIGGKKAALDGVGSKLKAEDIKKWIRTPKEMKPNATMKPYPNLPGKDLDDLVTFLMTLR